MQISFISEVSDPSPSLNYFWLSLFLFLFMTVFMIDQTFLELLFLLWDKITVIFPFRSFKQSLQMVTIVFINRLIM